MATRARFVGDGEGDVASAILGAGLRSILRAGLRQNHGPAFTSTPASDILYPDSHGKSMADNTKQYRWIVMLKENLEIFLAIVGRSLLHP